jgi:hypothetical protein
VEAALSGVIGAIIGAAGAFLATLLTLRNQRLDSRKKMHEAAVQTLVQTYDFLEELREYVEDGPPLDETIVEGLRKERRLVRTNLMILRQLYPQPSVRHSAEILTQEIDRGVGLLDPSPEEEEQAWRIIMQSWHSAYERANSITRQLRVDRREVDKSYIVSVPVTAIHSDPKS